jgi:hypothetical protein
MPMTISSLWPQEPMQVIELKRHAGSCSRGCIMAGVSKYRRKSLKNNECMLQAVDGGLATRQVRMKKVESSRW